MAFGLKEPSKLFNAEPRIPDNATHGECIHRIVTRNGEDPRSVCHDHMRGLSKNAKTSFL